MRHLFVTAFIVGAGLFAPAAGQGVQPTLKILSPEDGTYVSSEVTIQAAVEPASTVVQRMTFFVDGRRVCNPVRPPFQCVWNVGKGVAQHTFRVVAYLAGGGRIAQTVRSKAAAGFTDNADVDIVHVTATVLEGSQFAEGLDRAVFHVYEDDVEQRITYFTAKDVPLELLTGIDVSQSMTASIDEMKENARDFLSAVKAPGGVTVTAFNDNFFVLARPSADLAARLEAVDHLAPFGATALHDTLFRSFGLLGSQSGRRAMVMFTDGDDTSSRVSREAVERRAETSDAVLYMIGQGRAIESRPLKDLCDRLAQKSGGRAFFPRTMQEVRANFNEILAELSHQYLLGYVPPSQRRDSTWHRIRVEVDGGLYTVRARQGYRFKTSG